MGPGVQRTVRVLSPICLNPNDVDNATLPSVGIITVLKNQGKGKYNCGNYWQWRNRPAQLGRFSKAFLFTKTIIIAIIIMNIIEAWYLKTIA